MSHSASATEGETDQEVEPLGKHSQLERHTMEGQPESSDDPQIKADDSDQTGQYDQGLSDAASLKRRRVTRACDECRRKKIKCDGKVRLSTQRSSEAFVLIGSLATVHSLYGLLLRGE